MHARRHVEVGRPPARPIGGSVAVEAPASTNSAPGSNLMTVTANGGVTVENGRGDSCVTAENSSAGSTPSATSVATRRSAACSSASARSPLAPPRWRRPWPPARRTAPSARSVSAGNGSPHTSPRRSLPRCARHDDRDSRRRCGCPRRSPAPPSRSCRRRRPSRRSGAGRPSRKRRGDDAGALGRPSRAELHGGRQRAPRRPRRSPCRHPRPGTARQSASPSSPPPPRRSCAKISAGGASSATSVATCRSAACSSASRSDLRARLGVGDRGGHEVAEPGDAGLGLRGERLAARTPRPSSRPTCASRRRSGNRPPSACPSARARSATLPASCEKSSIRCGRPSRSTRAITESPSSVSRVPTRTPGALLGPRTATAVTVPSPSSRHSAESPSPSVLATSSATFANTASSGAPARRAWPGAAAWPAPPRAGPPGRATRRWRSAVSTRSVNCATRDAVSGGSGRLCLEWMARAPHNRPSTTIGHATDGGSPGSVTQRAGTGGSSPAAAQVATVVTDLVVLVTDHSGEIGAEKRPDLSRDRAEQLSRRDVLCDERRHPPQRRLLAARTRSSSRLASSKRCASRNSASTRRRSVVSRPTLYTTPRSGIDARAPLEPPHRAVGADRRGPRTRPGRDPPRAAPAPPAPALRHPDG